MRKKRLLFVIVLLGYLSMFMYADEATRVTFVNKGKMVIAEKGTVYVPSAVLMTDMEGSTSSEVEIWLQGIFCVGGNFYQESASQVFKIDAAGWGVSTGKLIFVGNHSDGKRYVQMLNAADMNTFERWNRYVAFPNIEFVTNDTVMIPCRMGIDASSIAVGSGYTGKFYLQSGVIQGRTYDASLRISGVGATGSSSAQLVAPGSVIVGRDLSLYRSATNPLFAFASPFTNMRSGYFAGNYVRRFQEDAITGHVEYVLANADLNGDGFIDGNNYLFYADSEFQAGKGYLIKPQIAGYNYEDHSFTVGGNTNAAYDLGCFVFDGTVYEETYYAEQLFADEKLFEKVLNGVTYSNTVNLIIGNSYSSALSLEKLKLAMSETGLQFSSTIYVWPAGATSYQAYKLTDNLNAFDLEDIPAMSYVMLRLSRNKNQTGSLTIDRSFQTHGKMSHGMQQSRQSYHNEVVFRVSPTDNEHVYDLAMMALRAGGGGSVSKVLNPNGEAFSLYAGAGRSICVGEEDTESMPLYFTAFPGVEDYTLQVSRQESMNTEALWLEDRQSGVWTDLFNVDVYNFRGVSGDIVPRFYVHFKQCAPLGLSEGYDNRSALSAFYSAGSIYVQGLDAEDLESDWRILDMQGRLLMQGVIKSSPEMIIPTDLLPGIYALFVGGERNQSFKFVVKGGAQ